MLKRRSDIFDFVGYVDERTFCKDPLKSVFFDEKEYAGFRKLALDEALNCPGLEAVTVEVPNRELVPVALRCMERELAMHMDKPAGEDLALYRKLLDGCQAKNLPFQMGYMFRGNPAFRFCLEAIRNKLLGEIFEITADMDHNYGGEAYQEYIANFPGGLMFNLGCHLIDFVVAALGRPEKVTPFLKSAPGYPGDCHNNCMAVLEYPHALVSIRSCSKTVGGSPGRAMKIAGTNGTIRFSPLERFDGKGVEIHLKLERDTADYPAGTHTLVFPPQRDRYEEQLLELAEAIREKKLCSYSFEHDCLVHEVTLAAANYIEWR